MPRNFDCRQQTKKPLCVRFQYSDGRAFLVSTDASGKLKLTAYVDGEPDRFGAYGDVAEFELHQEGYVSQEHQARTEHHISMTMLSGGKMKSLPASAVKVMEKKSRKAAA